MTIVYDKLYCVDNPSAFMYNEKYVYVFLINIHILDKDNILVYLVTTYIKDKRIFFMSCDKNHSIIMQQYLQKIKIKNNKKNVGII